MTIRPIIFSGPMVRAILDGRKTQTRRVVKIPAHLDARHAWADAGLGAGGYLKANRLDDDEVTERIYPFCEVSDLLWVRETVWQASPYPGTLPSGEPDESSRWSSRLVYYASDGNPPNCGNRHYGPDGLRNGSFAAPDPYAVWLRRPSIHMPRWASRLTLAVSDVRVELLRDISEDDAEAEGLAHISKDGGFTWKFGIPDRDGEPGSDDDGWDWSRWCLDPRRAFAELWDSINGAKPGRAWDDNPWVVAITFTPIHANVDDVVADRVVIASAVAGELPHRPAECGAKSK